MRNQSDRDNHCYSWDGKAALMTSRWRRRRNADLCPRIAPAALPACTTNVYNRRRQTGSSALKSLMIEKVAGAPGFELSIGPNHLFPLRNQ